MNALAALGQVQITPDAASIFSGSLTAPVAASAGPDSFNALIGMLRDLMEPLEDVPEPDSGMAFELPAGAPTDWAFGDAAPKTATPVVMPAPRTATPDRIAQAIVRRMLGEGSPQQGMRLEAADPKVLPDESAVPAMDAPALEEAKDSPAADALSPAIFSLPVPQAASQPAPEYTGDPSPESRPLQAGQPAEAVTSRPSSPEAAEPLPGGEAALFVPAPVPVPRSVPVATPAPASAPTPASTEASIPRFAEGLLDRVTPEEPKPASTPLAFGLRLTPAGQTPEAVQDTNMDGTNRALPAVLAQIETSELAPPDRPAQPPAPIVKARADRAAGAPNDAKPRTIEPRPGNIETVEPQEPLDDAHSQPDDVKAAEKPARPEILIEKRAESAAPVRRFETAHPPASNVIQTAKDSAPSEPITRPGADVVSALRSSENIALSRPVVAAPAASSQAIAVRVARPDAAPIDVHVRERRGEIQVAVRTVDPELQSNLRHELNTLVNSLENSGYRTETVVPREPPRNEIPHVRFAAVAGLENGAFSTQPMSQQGGSQSRGESGEQTGGRQQQPQQQQQNQQQHRRPPWTLWRETLEQTR